MRWCVLLVWLLMLAGCGGSTVIQAPTPPPPTPDPLAPLIVIDGDLTGYHASSTPMIWRLYPNVPYTSSAYYYEISPDDDFRNEIGHITVLHYATESEAESAYIAVRTEAEMRKEPEPINIGEKGSISGPSPDFKGSDALWFDCKTVAHISLTSYTVEKLRTYMTALHERLEPIICAT